MEERPYQNFINGIGKKIQLWGPERTLKVVEFEKIFDFVYCVHINYDILKYTQKSSSF